MVATTLRVVVGMEKIVLVKIAKKLAIKFWRFSVRRKGSGVSPVSSTVLSGKTRVFAKNQAGSRKKSETADDGGGCVSAALNGP